MSKAALAKKLSTDPVLRALDAADEAILTMTTKEAFQVAVRAGIYTADGKLTDPYRSKPAHPKASRATRVGGKGARRPKGR